MGILPMRVTARILNPSRTLTYAAQPTFATPTSYVDDVDKVLEALKKAAR